MIIYFLSLNLYRRDHSWFSALVTRILLPTYFVNKMPVQLEEDVKADSDGPEGSTKFIEIWSLKTDGLFWSS